MAISPVFAVFEKQFSEFDAIPVCRTVLADQLTPVSAFARLDDGRDACLFESVIGGEQVGRYSFLAVRPHREFLAYGTDCTIRAKNSGGGTLHTAGDGTRAGWEQEQRLTRANPLAELRQELNRVRVARLPGLPPFTGGAVGFAAYDVVRYVEHLPDSPPDDRGMPDMAFGFYDTVLVFDNISKKLHVVVLAWRHEHGSPRAAYDHAIERIDQVIERLGSHQSPRLISHWDIAAEQAPIATTSNFTPDEFHRAVRTAVDYIHQGDIFQVVLSQRLQVPIGVDPFEIYRDLRVLNPSPFMFFLRAGGTTLVGASPEIMCRVVGDLMTVRPLAGTRPRGATPEQDLALEQELLADEKERAEHAMLVDLGRNDVGKVSRFGSVKLLDQFSVERYSHVMHLSSTVQGRLREDCDVFDAFMASHPAGTVSGAPKVRAMQIIDELEPHRRGPYAGAVGYIDYSGNMDTCIALRTMVIQNGIAYVQAGAGVVADSDPQAEYQETLNKSQAMLRAIEAASARQLAGPK